MPLYRIERQGADLVVYGDVTDQVFYAAGNGFWISGDQLEEVTPVNLVVSSGVVRIPNVRGVQYMKNGVAVAAGSSHIISGDVTFTAVPLTGYRFPDGDWRWDFSPYLVEPDDLGMVNNTVRIPSVEGVQYRRNGSNIGNGGTYEITERTTFDAIPRTGYRFPAGEDYSWTFEPSPEESSDFKFPFPRNSRNSPYRNHSGIDWAGGRVGSNADIRAIGTGTVIQVYNYGGNTFPGDSSEPVWRGRCVVVDHGMIGGRRIWSLYAHMSSLSVSNGDTVTGGQKLGVIGNTGFSNGTHLHFEVIYNGRRLTTSVGGGYERTLGWLDANADGSW